MKQAFTILFLLFSSMAHAQLLKERRVYYLDCSYSMKSPNGIWNEVRENLKNAIDKVSDETTDLLVVPFAFDHNHHTYLTAFASRATAEGKAELKKKIDALSVNKSSMTYHSDPLQDFYNNKVDASRVTYMFLMTDGQNEEKTNDFHNLLNQWGSRYAQRNVYGFYVMLNAAARNSKTSSIIHSQPNLWEVETADVNINMIRLQSSAIYNARADKYFELPMWGNTKGMHFSANFPPDSPYKVGKVQIENGKLRVYVSFMGDVYHLPPFSIEKMMVKLHGGGPFDFLVTEMIPVKCVSKPERSLKVTVR